MKQLSKLSDAEYLVHLCMTPAPKTEAVHAFRQEIDRKGVSVAALARQHNIKARDIYPLLYGRNKGKRGEAHRIAVLLGLKDGVISQP